MKRYLSLILIVFLLVLSGCGSPTTDEQVLRIGVILPLTEKAAQYGAESQNGIELALKETREKLEGFSIEVFYEDSRFDPKEGVKGYKKLKDLNNIDVVITGTSPVGVAVAPLANNDETLQMAIFTSNPAYSSPDDFTFRVSTTAKIESGELAKLVMKKNKNVAVMHINNEYGVGQKETFVDGFEDLGGDVVIEEAFLLEENDFRTPITKIKEKNPEAVVLLCESKNAGMIIKQAKELGFETQWYGIRSIQGEDVVNLGGEAAEGLLYTYPFDLEVENEIVQQFVESYTETYGEAPTAYSVEGYDGFNLVIHAVEKCQKVDTSCMKDVLESVDGYKGVLGELTFDEKGDVYYTFFVKTLRDGEFVAVEK